MKERRDAYDGLITKTGIVHYASLSAVEERRLNEALLFQWWCLDAASRVSP